MLVTSLRRERAIDRCGLRGWLLRRRSRCAVTADGESDHRLPGGSSHAIAHWIARRVTSTAACHARRFAGGTGHNSDGSLTQYGGARRRKAHGPARVHHPLRRDGVCQPGATARGQGGQFGDSGAALVEIVHERVPRRRRGYALQIQLPPSGASGRFGVDRGSGLAIGPLRYCTDEVFSPNDAALQEAAAPTSALGSRCPCDPMSTRSAIWASTRGRRTRLLVRPGRRPAPPLSRHALVVQCCE